MQLVVQETVFPLQTLELFDLKNPAEAPDFEYGCQEVFAS
jgi:hypothetical protein